MKKIGKKLSFLTKILLVIGLLISNLSSLSIVFAYEAPDDVVITLNDDVLEIKYTEELAEEVEAVDVRVYEKYTYLNGLSERVVETSYSLTAEQLLTAVAGTLELTHNSIFTLEGEGTNNYKLFDGTYNVKVEIVDVTVYEDEVITTDESEELTEAVALTGENVEIQTEEVEETVLATGVYEEEMTHKSGLEIKLYDSINDVEIEAVDEKYPVSSEYSRVQVVAKVLSGGLNPTDVFEYNNRQYMAFELIEEVFTSEKDFAGYLFGDYELPVEVKLLKQLPVATIDEEVEEVEESLVALEEENYEEVIYNSSVNVLYESYEKNAELLNSVANNNGYDEAYLFYSVSKDGLLYVLSDFETEVEEVNETVVTKSMLDLYNMMNEAVGVETGEGQIITYTLLKDGVDVLEGFVPQSEEDTLEDYLATIIVDDTVEVVLSNTGLTVTFDVVVVGDLNNDNKLTKDDVSKLIDQVIGESQIEDIEKSDVYGMDKELNSLDVLYLNQAVDSETWNVRFGLETVALNAKLETKFNDALLSEENYLTSGDEFTVDYILSLTDYDVNGIAGRFDYDKTLFELVSVKVNYDWMGNDEDGKFIYLGDENLTGPELEELENSENAAEENQESVEAVLLEEVVPTEDYVLVTATFKALKNTNEESENIITLDEIELFNSTENGVIYYELDNNIIFTDNIDVVASDDNTLSYLEVAGVEIELQENVFEYEITVASDVTAVDLKYILNNIAANVTSEVYPEELVEGSNTVIVTVVSESGISQEYTVTVIREKVVETTTQVNYNNNYYEDNNNVEEEVVTPEVPVEEEEPEEEEEVDLSKIVIIALILIVIVGLVYLIFKDDEDEEINKANKDINKLKKESLEPEIIKVEKSSEKKVTKTTSNSSSKTSSNSTKVKNAKTKTNTNKKER